jgi:hypothetical protein
MEQSNHGSHAKVGDIVELLNPSGHPTAIFALVTEAYQVWRAAGAYFEQRVKIHLTKERGWAPIKEWKANYCRIVSRA